MEVKRKDVTPDERDLPMKKNWRWIGIGTSALILGLVIGGSIQIYYSYQRSANFYIKAAEGAYGEGIKHWPQSDTQAMTCFHEAILHAENGFKVLEKERSSGSMSPDQQTLLVKQEGLLYWIKMKALRARCLAKWQSEGKTIPAAEAQGNRHPSLWIGQYTPNRLPDETMRQEAVYCLRQAALRLADVLEVQQEAVALEMQIEPKQWPMAQIVAQQLLTLEPKDERVHYILARYEFEQPVSANTQQTSQPLPLGKRSRERMQKALEHLVQLKRLETPPRWRTLHLEAEIHQWLLVTARNPNQRKGQDEQKALQALHRLLFADTTGVLNRVRQLDAFGPMSRLDTEGLLQLHQMALDRRLDELRRGPQSGVSPGLAPGSASLEPLVHTVVAIIDVQKKILQGSPTTWQVGACAESAAWTANRVQAQFTKEQPETWQRLYEHMHDCAETALAQRSLNAATVQRLAEIAYRDAQWFAKAGQMEMQRQRSAQAVHWIDAGLQLGQDQSWSAAAMLQLHEVAGRIKASQGLQRDALQPHLLALKEAKSPAIQASAFLLEGALAEREGRLEKARDALEKAVQLAPGTDLARRAHSVLGTLYLALNQPDKALASLKEVETLYRRWDQLTEEERAWLYEFIRGPEDVVLLQIEGHLAMALKTVPLLKNGSVDPDAVRETVQRHEQAALKLAQSFAPRSPRSRIARERMALYLINGNRVEEAEKALAQLRGDFPDSLSVLRMQHQWQVRRRLNEKSAAATPPDWRDIDQHIQQFISHYPQQTAARVYWVEWLLTTDRLAEAKAYLADPTHFPAGSDDRGLQRVRTLVQLMSGERSADQAVVQTAVRDPLVDAVLIQTAANVDAKQQQIDSALQRYESKGLFQCLNANLALARQDYVESAKGFLSALECTAVRSMARRGLQSSLMSLAQQDPVKAREYITQFLQEYPSEPALLISYAQACLAMGDFGQPQQRDNKIKDMASALNALESALMLNGSSTIEGAWIKAQYWQQIGRLDVARAEINRILMQQPKHEGALLLSVTLAMDSYDPVQWQTARQQIAILQELQAKSPVPRMFLAQIMDREGQTEKALQLYDQIISEFPSYGPAYALAVDARLRSADAASAYPLIRRWREAVPMDWLAARSEIRYLASTGQVDACRTILDQFQKQMMEKVPDSSQAIVQQAIHAQVVATLAQGLIQSKAYGEAQAWLERCLDQRPDDEACLLLAGEICLNQMKEAPQGPTRQAMAQKAMHMYAKVYQHRKGHLIAGNNLAWLLAKELNDPAEAYRLLQEVRQNRFTSQPMPVEMMPADLLDTYGVVLEAMNESTRIAEQRDLFEAARRRYPMDARFCFYLGRAYQKLGDRAKAQQSFDAAVALANKPHLSLSTEKRQTLLSEIERLR